MRLYLWLIRPPLTPPTQEGKEVSCLERQEGGEVDALEEISAVKTFVCDFDDEVHIDLLWIEMPHKIIHSHRCATCSQQVIMDQYDIVFIDRIEMYLNRIFTILFNEALFDYSCGKFSRLTCHNEAAP